ncbi:BC1872 family protein [Laceyella putida]|uniref:Phage ABA sandwich domain-containing protein n=1 Tax=Laceyella putida TaxID=110101 RepID=A0ABW2RRB6_9BACL
MTEQQRILAMQQGRELDRMVADQVMGKMISDVPDLDALPPGFMLSDEAIWQMMSKTDESMVQHPKFVHSSIPFYSADISHAFQVVKHLQERGKEVVIRIGKKVQVSVDDVTVEGDALPELICKAALLAMV